MNWKKQLRKFEHFKDWKSGIELLQKAINDTPNDLDAYLLMNYLFMNLLVEENYDSTNQVYYTSLLKKYFLESYSKFSNNPDYLFYTGITAHISEWHFEIDIEEAKTMIKEALRRDPENILYKWGYFTYLDMSNANYKKQGAVYAKKIVEESPAIVEMLKSKGALGEYILNIIEYSCKKITI